MRLGDAQPRTKDPRTQGPGGFTLIELLVVIVILGVLIALLLPAISAAVRTARNAAVLAEINQLASALASFQSKYGDYPPSRVLLMENGNYSTFVGSNALVSTLDPTSPTTAIYTGPPAGNGDITVGQLAARTMTTFRKFWPKVQLSASGAVANINSNYWYDFNGNGHLDTTPYVLHGHECLVFFLGGIPVYDTATQSFGMSGFGKDPTNPFSNSIVGNAMNNANRDQAMFEFNPGRLFLDPTNTSFPVVNGITGGIPGYYDTINGGPPVGAGTGLGPVNFYAYFSANGNGNYDPNDVNFVETDAVTGTGITTLHYTVGSYIPGSPTPYVAASPSPNPYTSTLTVGGGTTGTSSGAITYHKPQTYQIISAGQDGLYGVGGQFQLQNQSASVPLPYDANHTIGADTTIRQREYDNLTNLKSGTLQ